MKKFLTNILLLLTILMVNGRSLYAAPTPQPTVVSLITKCSTVTALCGSVALYAALSNVYKQECLAKDEVMESADFKEYGFKIINGILSLDTDVRTKYMDKYPKIATTLQVTVAASGLMVLLGFNDLVNYLVRKPKPEMCSIETQVDKQMIKAELKKLKADAAVDAEEEVQLAPAPTLADNVPVQEEAGIGEIDTTAEKNDAKKQNKENKPKFVRVPAQAALGSVPPVVPREKGAFDVGSEDYEPVIVDLRPIHIPARPGGPRHPKDGINWLVR